MSVHLHLHVTALFKVSMCSHVCTSDQQCESASTRFSVALYTETCLHFCRLMPRLHALPLDRDLRLREQTLMCLVYICEVMEKAEGTSHYCRFKSTIHVVIMFRYSLLNNL